MELLGLLRHSSNYTFLVRMEPQDGPSFLAVYKPAEGETPLWDFPAGTLYRRDVAAYRLARHLGWPQIPPTVVRERGPHGVGVLQLFVEANPEVHYLSLPEHDEEVWQRVALFDLVVNNADRKSGHCLVDQTGTIWMIDHGLTFHPEPKLRTVIWDFAGRALQESLRADLERLASGLDSNGTLATELRELVGGNELEALRLRIQEVLQPRWRFPHPESGWSVPWPPI